MLWDGDPCPALDSGSHSFCNAVASVTDCKSDFLNQKQKNTSWSPLSVNSQAAGGKKKKPSFVSCGNMLLIHDNSVKLPTG